jgi:hypothetical protein
MTVVSDRMIYNPGETAHIFIAAPGAGGWEVDLELRLDGQAVYQARENLNEAGLYLGRYPDLEEGEYIAAVTLPERPEARAECTFLCTQFDPSALKVALDSHSFEDGKLIFVLTLTQAGAPYAGPVDLALRIDEHEIYKDQREVRDGRLKAGFRFKKEAGGVLRIEVTAPGGRAATTTLPSIGWEQFQKTTEITLSTIDPPAEVALRPFGDADAEIRGLHYRRRAEGDEEEETPFTLARLASTQGQIRAQVDASLVRVLVLDPFGGRPQALEYREVKAGDVLSFDVGGPYAVFTLGAYTTDRILPYEAWGTVIRPLALNASLDVPEAAEAGATIAARVEADRPAHCLLVVHDARLEHEDPLTRLAQRIFVHLYEATVGLRAGRVGRTGNSISPGSSDWEDVARRRRKTLGNLTTLRYLVKGLGIKDIPVDERVERLLVPVSVNLAPIESPETRLAAMLARREDSPELAHIELLRVEGRVEVPVQLGDGPGPWRCRAYFFRGHDYVSVTKDIEVVE